MRKVDMMFAKIFKRSKMINNENNSSSKSPQSSISTPSFQYVQTAGNRQKVVSKDNNVIVLWWISKKKKGYDKTTNKFPKWFEKQYGIDFNRVMIDFIKKGFLTDEDNIITMTTAGEEMLKEHDYVIYIHEHPQYRLTINDFKSAPNLNKVQHEDITWGIFNSRILNYTKNAMWTSLAANYGNMADLLVNEKKYEQALDFIFAAAFIETSGMCDNNELAPIMMNYTKRGKKKRYLSNGMPDIYRLEINNYYVTKPFMKAQDNLNIDWNEIKERYLTSRQIQALEDNLPFHYFEKEQSFDIFRQAIEAGRKEGVFSLVDCKRKLKCNTPDEHSKKYFYASTENLVNRKFGKK